MTKHIENPVSITRSSKRPSLEIVVPPIDNCLNAMAGSSIVAVPPPPRSSSTPVSKFNRYNGISNLEMNTMTPKATNCTIATHGRTTRSTQNKKQVTKRQHRVKHVIHDTNAITKTLLTSKREKKKASLENVDRIKSNVTMKSSPLCVKKKMSRRGKQHYCKNQPIDSIRGINNSKKLKIKSSGDPASLSVGQLRSLMDSSYCVSSSNCETGDRIVMPVETNIDVKKTVCEMKAVANNDEFCEVEASMNTTDHHDDIVPCVLFEESDDFWSSYLLQTFQQFATSVADQEDFDPIPYSLLARGLPVYIDNNSKIDEMIQNTAVSVESHIPENEYQNVGRRFGTPSHPIDLSSPGLPPVEHESLELLSIEEEQAKNANVIVGPKSWQMKVINQMILYLDEANDVTLSKYGKQFHLVRDQFTILHMAGEWKFRNLPGAIFEQMVSTIGGANFLEIYQNAKAFSPKFQSNRDLVCREITTCGGMSLSSIDTNPDTIQLAIGYGIYMAKSLGSVECINTKKYVEHGAQVIRNMSVDDRLLFWNKIILNLDQSSKSVVPV